MLCPTCQWFSDNVLSHCPIFRQCCVQQSNGWFMLSPTVRWLVSWVSNSPMVRLCFFPLSNGRRALCPTFQRLDNAVSNCPMFGQCCIQNEVRVKKTVKWVCNFFSTEWTLRPIQSIGCNVLLFVVCPLRWQPEYRELETSGQREYHYNCLTTCAWHPSI